MTGRRNEPKDRIEIYDLKGRLERVRHLIEASTKITPRNKEMIQRFHVHGFAEGLSLPRVLFYMNRLWNIARWVDKDFDQLTSDDLKKLVVRISQMDYTPQTKLDHNRTIRKFFVWLDGDRRRIDWLNVTAKPNETKLPEELITKEEVQNLVRASLNPRDKALVSVLWESGARVGEIMTLRIKHIEFDKYGAVAIVHGKTGSRRIRLVSCVPHLSSWLAHHPDALNPDAPLWVNIGVKHNGAAMEYAALSRMLQKVARRAGVKKRVNPHAFRHARATDLAKVLTEAQMKEFFGWTRSSDMAAVYVHLSGRDTDRAILGLYGKLNETEKEEESQLTTQSCTFCKFENAPELDLCMNCRRPLNLKAAMDAERREQEFLRRLTPEAIEQMIETKVEEILARKRDERGN